MSDEKLKVIYAEKYKIIKVDTGHAQKDVTFYRPDCPKESQYSILGDYAQGTKPDKELVGQCVVVKDPENKFTKPPTDYIKLWDSTDFNHVGEYFTIWQPVAPEGYIALGFIVQKGTKKPSTNLMRY